jgi:Tfp pilus assembly protein PilX
MMRRARGSALIIVVVFLGIFAVAMAGVVRSTNTSARTAGNVAFKQAATQASEVALAAGESFVGALGAPDTAQANRYFQWYQTIDAQELPTTVNWTNVASTTVGNFTVQWVVERMCQPPPTSPARAFDASLDCMTVQGEQQGSQRAGSPSYSTGAAIYYRITARVTGPRNTESFVQTAVSR